MFKLMEQAVRAPLPRWLLTGCALLELSTQQITGTPASPCATTTIGGHEIPPSPLKFEGKIERNAVQSTPYWPGRIVRRKGAPNVLLITTDDTDFSVSSTFRGAAVLA